MTTTPLPPVKASFFDSNGDPLIGGKIYTYIGGTTTPLATYTDSTGATPNANPVVLDANGQANIWLGPSFYKIIVKNSSDVTQYTTDNVAGGTTGSGGYVLATSPTLVTPILGAATATSINFGGTSLSTYSEGTWTPTDASGASLSFTVTGATYTRIGNIVFVNCFLTYPATASGANALIGGLPFTSKSTVISTGMLETNATLANPMVSVRPGSTTIAPLTTGPEANILNSTLSSKFIIFSAVYNV